MTAPRPVSIVIPCLNQKRYTALCIESIVRYTDYPYELIAVDNGSRDGTPGYLASLRGTISRGGRSSLRRYTVIANRRNRGVAGALNQAIGRARGGYLCYLNNDVMVSPGWLTRLVQCSERDAAIGIVGVHLHFAFARNRLSPDASSLYREIERYAAGLSLLRRGRYCELPGVHGCCMLVKNEVIERVGLFDESYYPCFGEDIDYSFRAVCAGYRLVAALDVYLHHFGMKTTAAKSFTRRFGRIDRIRQANFGRFLARWGEEGRRFLHPASTVPAAERA